MTTHIKTNNSTRSLQPNGPQNKIKTYRNRKHQKYTNHATITYPQGKNHLKKIPIAFKSKNY